VTGVDIAPTALEQARQILSTEVSGLGMMIMIRPNFSPLYAMGVRRRRGGGRIQA